MSYSTISDLQKIISSYDLARVTGDDTGSSVDSDRVDYAIESADALINGIIGKVYKLPLSENHKLIRDLSANLALVFLYEYYYRDADTPGFVKDKKSSIIANLNNIQHKTMKLENEEYISKKSKTSKTFEENAITKEELEIFGGRI